MTIANYYASEMENNINMLRSKINEMFDNLLIEIENRRSTLLQQLNNYMTLNHVEPSCVRLVNQIDSTLFDQIQNFGKIDDGRASAGNSTATGIGLKYAIENEPSQFKLRTYNKNHELAWVEQDEVEVSIKKDESTYKCIVRNNCDGVYDIYYELPQSGEYEIFVKVNGFHIPDSPFLCQVLERQSVDFYSEDLVFQEGKNTALLQKPCDDSKTFLYALNSDVKAWKFKVTTADPKYSFKVGYTDNNIYIPDICNKIFCEFQSSELVNKLSLPQNIHVSNRYHGASMYNRSHRRSKPQRKQSSFERSSLTFMVFLDVYHELLHVALEETGDEKVISIADIDQAVFPFIEITHHCSQTNCPRPLLTFF